MAHRIWGAAVYWLLPTAINVVVLSSPVFASGQGCMPPAPTPNLNVRDGFVEFIAPDQLRPFMDALPHLAKPALDQVMRSADTMWYDETSMVFLYQDSVESVVGGRANCVGRMVGERNRDNVIGKLLGYFGEDFKFKYPFRKAAGTDNVTNSKVFNFWSLPRRNGHVLPVKWWKESARGRWHWVFPVGTTFGEVLFERAPDGRYYAFEVRARTRYRDGWAVDLLRPFLKADDLAAAVIAKRPEWQTDAHLKAAVNHLTTRTNLTPYTLRSEAYAKVFPPIPGSLDQIPDFGDPALVADLLTTTPFKSTEGMIWKEGGGLETYAPGSLADFSVVPKGYELGMIPVNDLSCNRCHVETGRPVGDFEFDIQLYGEVWGEDRIFTWHLFEANEYVFDTWDDSDSPTRRVNPRFTEANLLQNARPAADDPDYKQLPVPYQTQTLHD